MTRRKSLIGTGDAARLASFADSLGQAPAQAPRQYDLLARVTPNLRVVEGPQGLHKEGSAVARVVTEAPTENERCVVYVFGPRRETDAQLLALAYDHALLLHAVRRGRAYIADHSVSDKSWVSIGHHRTRRAFACGFDSAGCPVLTEELRAALRKAVELP